ncbi:MAG: GNAT family N-acetyltransferase [Lachnospiraceae bacterium]|nr:GNAT family N-acetyltransferase [Lachnospiraceae bacterium]
MLQGKYLAGGLQSGCTANSIGVQYTLPQYRRKGLAEQLVRNCLQSAREWGAGRP